jgi:hypothetical protein
MRKWLFALTVLLGLLFSRDVGAEARSKPIAAGPTILVEWGGTWWLGSVVEKRAAGRALIHYEGWGKDWDEEVGPERRRSLVDDGELFVEYGATGQVWAATATRGTKEGLQVQFVAQGVAHDEVVPFARIHHALSPGR